MIWFWDASLVICVFLAPVIQAAETNWLSATPAPATGRPLPSPQDIATAHERAGRRSEAASLYEEIVRTNSSARKVLSHRLVTLYVETGETNKALTWAREVMRDNPDPQAYLARVHARLGQTKAAREILEREVGANTNTTRAITLRWQLSDLYAQQDSVDEARQVLSQAAGLAKGTPMEAAAHRRLNALTGRTK